ncbi:hypothetical protein RF11_12881 [Thelohanellus kitauei]|uniref:Uncharacterized protein n=1 Tax=Thelohanellus kitauei TaxID=669202 RepID=A0A0C2MII3_THEKT|nr:hypothetical protein RF11_12881 [Thelohanellus kitauei]
MFFAKISTIIISWIVFMVIAVGALLFSAKMVNVDSYLDGKFVVNVDDLSNMNRTVMQLSKDFNVTTAGDISRSSSEQSACQGKPPVGKLGYEKDDKYSCIYNDVYNDNIEYQGNFRSRSNTENDYEFENECIKEIIDRCNIS